MARTREAVIVLLDCGRTMTATFERSSKTKFGLAQDAVALYIQQKILFSPKDEIGIIYLGTKDTKNPLNAAGSGYEHVTVGREVEVADVDFARQVLNKSADDVETDLIDGLIVAVDMMITKCKSVKGKINKTIFLFTDGCSPIEGEDDTKLVSEQLVMHEIKLVVVGFGFEDPSAPKAPTENKKKSPTQLKNEYLLRKLCDDPAVGGSVCPSSSVFDNLRKFRSRSVAQTSKCRTDLEVTPYIQIPVWVYIKTRVQPFPTLKKQSAMATAGSEGNVKMSRSYHKEDDPDGEEVPALEQTKAFRYGAQLVPISEADQPMMKLPAEKCLKCLGAIPSDKISRQFCTSNVEAVAAAPGNKKAATALSSLINALYELDYFLLARYCYRNNSPPKLVLLTPKISSDYECLYLNYLPFNEDIRSLSFPPLPVPSESAIQCVDRLIASMDMMGGKSCGVEDENGAALSAEMLKPKYTFNPSIQRFYQALLLRSLDRKAPLPELDPKICSYLLPDDVLKKQCLSVMEEVKKEFPLEKVQAKAARTKRFWRDAVLEKEEMLTKTVDVKKIKIADVPLSAGPAGAADGAGPPSADRAPSAAAAAVSVGTAQPVRDFERMMRDSTTDLVSVAIDQLSGVIERYVKEGLGTQLHSKALECLVALRGGCVTEMEPMKFNSFLHRLREMSEGNGKRDALWKRIKDSALTLIHKEECAKSDVSKTEAQSFVTSQEPTSTEAAAAPAAASNADEDLLDLIE